MPQQRAQSTNAVRLQRRFREREERRNSMECFLSWFPSKVRPVQWNENEHGEIDPTTPVDFRSWEAACQHQRNKSDANWNTPSGDLMKRHCSFSCVQP